MRNTQHEERRRRLRRDATGAAIETLASVVLRFITMYLTAMPYLVNEEHAHPLHYEELVQQTEEMCEMIEIIMNVANRIRRM